jgi:DNA-binding beta-propeller fold protein YncE
MFTIKHYQAGSFNYDVYETESYSVSRGYSTETQVDAACINFREPGTPEDSPRRALIMNRDGEKAYVTNSSGQTVDKIETYEKSVGTPVNRRVQKIG